MPNDEAIGATMEIILPRGKNRLPELIKTLSNVNYESIFSQLNYKIRIVELPKFRID